MNLPPFDNEYSRLWLSPGLGWNYEARRNLKPLVVAMLNRHFYS